MCKVRLKQIDAVGSRAIEVASSLEARPYSAGGKEMLRGEIEAVAATRDTRMREASLKLLTQVKARPDKETHVHNAIGSSITQGDRGETARVNVERRED